MARLTGFGIWILAAGACPCHLPLLIGVLGGTTMGAVLAAHFLTAFVLLGAVFVGAVAVGLRALEAGSGRACARDGARSTP
jgi:mercuric ion transport protein